MTDQEILLQFRSEQTRNKAFTGLVNAYSKKIYWHVRRMLSDHDDANDVVQNVFVKVWKGLNNFREDSQLYTWLFRIATNEAITFLNDKHRKYNVPMHVASEQSEVGTKPDKLTTEPWLDEAATIRKLQEAIDALPDKQKQVFILRYYDELKYEEMEQLLGTSAGALKASYHHAVKKIEKFMLTD